MKPATKADVKRTAKGIPRTSICQTENGIFWTQTNYAVQVRGVVAEFLTSLGIDPNVPTNINDAWVTEGGDTPNLDVIFGRIGKSYVAIEPTTLGGCPVLVMDLRDRLVEIWNVGNARTALDAAFMGVCRAVGAVEWRSSGQDANAAGYSAAGALIAVVVPVRLSDPLTVV